MRDEVGRGYNVGQGGKRGTWDVFATLLVAGIAGWVGGVKSDVKGSGMSLVIFWALSLFIHP
jgi:hypothetical protein